MNFRFDINGLRAIAVIAVVLFHFNFEMLKGGFAGVDVFFVISGFLMTGMIFRGFEKDTFSLFKFYVARANRIIPALAILCLCLLIFSWFVFLDASVTDISGHIISALTFISNITFYHEAGYFDVSAQQKWLLHTWSLSAEWQFYLLYPLVLLPLNKFFNLKSIKIFLFIGMVIGFSLGVYASLRWPNAAYYLLPTRAWEMMAGGIVYLYPIKMSYQKKRIIEFIGLVLIIFSYLYVDKNEAWPGYYALIPVLGSYLIILSNRQDSFITNNFVFQYFGKWSYSIYLWHWPLLVYMYNYTDGSHFHSLIFIFLSILLGAISYEYIERKIKGKSLVLLYIIVMCFASINYYKKGHFSFRAMSADSRNQIIDKYDDYIMDTSYLFDECNASFQMLETGIAQVADKCISSKPNGVFIWGDSHMGSLSTGIRHELPDSIPFSQLTSSGCAPSFTIKRNGSSRGDVGCDYSNGIAYQEILRAKPNVVILGASSDHEKNDWRDTVDELYNMGIKKVIIIGPFPQWRPSLVSIYVERHVGEVFISDPQFDSRLLKSNEYLESLHKKKGDFIFINALADLCVDLTVDKPLCRVKVDDALMSFDYGHLTAEGSVYISKNFVIPKIIKYLN